MPCLYRLTAPSGKCYIGISVKPAETRFAKHTEHAAGRRPGALYAAMRKYGSATFLVETLVISDNWDYLCALERRAIGAFGTFAPGGYNMTLGGEGAVGPRDAATRAKISVAQKKRYENAGQRQLLAEAGQRGRLGRVRQPPKSRRKANPILRGSEEHRSQIRLSMMRPEVKEKMRVAAKARAADSAWRGKISASKTGKKIGPASEERKARIAAARRREWADPIIRERRLAALVLARAAKVAKRLEGATTP